MNMIKKIIGVLTTVSIVVACIPSGSVYAQTNTHRLQQAEQIEKVSEREAQEGKVKEIHEKDAVTPMLEGEQTETGDAAVNTEETSENARRSKIDINADLMHEQIIEDGSAVTEDGEMPANSGGSLMPNVSEQADEAVSVQAEEESTTISELFPDKGLARVISFWVGEEINTPIKMIRIKNLSIIKQPNFFYKEIKSLEGLQYATNVTIIDLNDQDISDLRPISGLTKLKTINLRQSRLTDITPLQGLTNLETLVLRGNNIRDLRPLASLANLKELDLMNNGITDLTGLSTLSKLQQLDLGVNQISDLTELSSLTSLQNLILHDNKIVDLRPLITLAALTDLNLRSNYLTDISLLPSIGNLQSLWLGSDSDYQNDISDYSPLIELENLEILHLQNKGISRIPRVVLERVKELYVPGSHITDLTPFLDLTNLVKLNLFGNNIADISTLPNAPFPLLKTLDLSANTITDITPLRDISWPQIEEIHLILQSVEEERWYNSEIIVENKVKDLAGNLVAPDTITPTEYGVYEAPNIIWTLPLPSKDLTLRYHWTKKYQVGAIISEYGGTYTVKVLNHYPLHFIVDDVVYESVEYLPNEIIPQPEKEPEKAGYTFIGWYTEATGGRQWDFSIDKMPAHELTLYARYTVNSYNVLFDNDGEMSEPIGLDYGELITEPVQPQKEGYTFTGWYTDVTGGRQWDFTIDKMPANDLTLYARYAVNSYTMLFNDEGVIGEPLKVNFGELVNEPVQHEKAGYKFIGWYTQSEGGRRWDFAMDVMPAEDVMLYARYVVNRYSVSFNNDGLISDSIFVNVGELINEPVQPEKVGYTFTGWYTEAEAGRVWNFAIDTMPAKDLVLYAQWEQEQANQDLVMNFADITISMSEFLLLQAEALLEEELINLADIQVVDVDGAIIYHNDNSLFVVENIDELLAIEEAGEYDVYVLYIGPKTFSTDIVIEGVVKLIIATDEPTNPGGSNTEQPKGEHTGDGSTSEDSNLQRTGERIIESLIFSSLLISLSLFILLNRNKQYLKKLMYKFE